MVVTGGFKSIVYIMVYSWLLMFFIARYRYILFLTEFIRQVSFQPHRFLQLVAPFRKQVIYYKQKFSEVALYACNTDLNLFRQNKKKQNEEGKYCLNNGEAKYQFKWWSQFFSISLYPIMSIRREHLICFSLT